MGEQMDTGPKGLLSRAKAILVDPQAEWARIADEDRDISRVLLNHALPLAAIGPVANFIGGQIFGYNAFGYNFRVGLVPALSAMIGAYVLSIVALFVLAAIVNLLAPRFGGTADNPQAFKLVTYSATAGWLAGIFSLVPSIAFLGILGLYSIYLFHAGAAAMLKIPQEKATGFTALVFVAAVLLYVLAGSLAATFA